MYELLSKLFHASPMSNSKFSRMFLLLVKNWDYEIRNKFSEQLSTYLLLLFSIISSITLFRIMEH